MLRNISRFYSTKQIPVNELNTKLDHIINQLNRIELKQEKAPDFYSYEYDYFFNLKKLSKKLYGNPNYEEDFNKKD